MDRENRRLVAIVAADIVGFSRLVGKDEEGTLRALRAHRADLIDPLIQEHGGRIANTAGDSLLLEFPSAVDAVRCSLAIQDGMLLRNGGIETENQILLRVGINVGDVIAEGDDLLGDGVNVAARLEGLADPGGICISNAAYEQVRDRLDIAFEDLGEVEVKNIARPVNVFRILTNGETAPAPRRRPTRFIGNVTDGRPLAIMLLILACAIAGFSTWQWYQKLPDVDQADMNNPGYKSTGNPAIAVLPFANLSEDKGQEYFADGMTDDLITDLSKVSSLTVIARNSVFTYKGKSVKVQEVAKDLNVTHVLEGSVRRAGEKLRINAQLIDALTGAHLWADRYDGKLADVFALQDRITEKIVHALSLKLSARERVDIEAPPTKNLEAYDAFQKAEAKRREGDIGSHYQAQQLYLTAIQKDRNFVQAYAGFAATLLRGASLERQAPTRTARAGFRGLVVTELLDEALRRGLALDPDNISLLATSALYHLSLLRHEKAKTAADKVVSARPGNLNARWIAAHVRVAGADPKEGRAAILALAALANRLDPDLLANIGKDLVMLGEAERGIDLLNQALAKEIGFVDVAAYLVAGYQILGKQEEAHNAIERFKDTWFDANWTYIALRLQHYKNKELLSRFVNALAEAGLPQWPRGFLPDEEQRVSAEELATYFQPGRRIFGMQNRGSRLQGDKLCRPSDTFGREYCAPVYRNPGGSKYENNELLIPGYGSTPFLTFSVREH